MRMSDWSSDVCSSDLLSAPACSPLSIPSVAQVSSPSAFTSRIISATLGMSRSFGERHAAPMQKREAPASFACLAFASTSSVLISFCRSEEHTSELQSLMRISYAVFCLKKKNNLFLDYYFSL